MAMNVLNKTFLRTSQDGAGIGTNINTGTQYSPKVLHDFFIHYYNL